jgi:hypothetical protein
MAINNIPRLMPLPQSFLLPPLWVGCVVFPHLLYHWSTENRRQTGNLVGHGSYQAQAVIEARKRTQPASHG